MIEVYGKENCPQCDQMKRHLEAKGVEYKYYMVGKDLSREELLDKCEAPVRMVPVVFKDGKHLVGTPEQVKSMI